MTYLHTCRLCIFTFGACLLFAGCLELVRRPTTGTDSRPTWADDGNPSAGEDVKGDTVASIEPGPAEPEPPSSVAENTGNRSTDTAGRTRLSLRSEAGTGSGEDRTQRGEDRTQRGEDHRQNVKQVNEYAFWCIQNAMWEEARLHLERALEQDSLAASLHNNLGVIYEKLGERDRAEQSYERARRLLPARELYGSNLVRLQDRKRRSLEAPSAELEMTAADTLGSDLEPVGTVPRGIR